MLDHTRPAWPDFGEQNHVSKYMQRIVFTIALVSAAAIETANTVEAADIISIDARRGNVAQRLDELNGQLAANAPTSVYIEIAGRPHALTSYDDALGEIALVRYNEAEFTDAYFADVEPVPGAFTTPATEPPAGPGNTPTEF